MTFPVFYKAQFMLNEPPVQSAAWGPHFQNKQNGGAHEMGISTVVKGNKYGSL